VDRRVQRTRLAVHQALIALMLEKGYDAITVQDIIERANIGRATFYAHYQHKEDLLRSGLKDLRKQLLGYQRAALAKAGSARERSLGFSPALFEHAYSHRDTYQAIVGRRSGAIVLGEMRAMLAELVRDDLKAVPPAKGVLELPRGAVVEFVVGALMSILTWWLDQKASIPPHEADAIFRRVAVNAIFE
jgi:AcrR family transcriptional regulator